MPNMTMTPRQRQQDYMSMLRVPFQKLCRLRFLNPDGSTAFALDNNPRNKQSFAFIADGSVTANWQNGQRLTASVTLSNVDQAFSLAFGKVWFGQQVALDEGLVLSNGEEYYRQTGVFVIDNPQERVDPTTRTVTYNLLDKWADLDGTLDGNLEDTHVVDVGTNIFSPIAALLAEDKGNGRPVDNVTPVFTEYYNDKTETLQDDSVISMAISPYTLTVDGDSATIAGVATELAAMVNAWIGYDNTGRLRVDPSQDDITDNDKPVLWRFSTDEAQLLGLSYTIKKEDVYNDYIIVGEMLDDFEQPAARAQNLDARSDTCIQVIGRKTKRENASGFASVTQCADLAQWRLKRASVLQKAVTVTCIQMMHIEPNDLVEIRRTDKPGSPVERHLVQGYTRPLAYNGPMTLSGTSVQDFPNAIVTDNSRNATASTFVFSITADTLTQSLYFTQSAPNAVVVDWGDGSTPSNPSGTSSTATHTYKEAGTYTVKLYCAEGHTWGPGANINGVDCSFVSNQIGYALEPALISADLGEKVTFIKASAFAYCSNFSSITMQNTITNVGNAAFRSTAFTSFVFPDSVTSYGGTLFAQCASFTSLTIGAGCTSLPGGFTGSGQAIASLTVRATTPPALVTRSLTYLASGCAIYVPAESVDAYKAAQYWSARASYIQAIPE